ncbi:hypothetical protein J6590_066527 [Homalodisca vitripennis]|nr:hypothetical protein J6590_066527 [Homalodisca vitripennis]
MPNTIRRLIYHLLRDLLLNWNNTVEALQVHSPDGRISGQDEGINDCKHDKPVKLPSLAGYTEQLHVNVIWHKHNNSPVQFGKRRALNQRRTSGFWREAFRSLVELAAFSVSGSSKQTKCTLTMLTSKLAAAQPLSVAPTQPVEKRKAKHGAHCRRAAPRRTAPPFGNNSGLISAPRRAAPRSRVRRGIIPLPELLGEVERNLFRWGGAARLQCARGYLRVSSYYLGHRRIIHDAKLEAISGSYNTAHSFLRSDPTPTALVPFRTTQYMPQLPTPIGQMGQYPGAQEGRFAVSPDGSSNCPYTSNSAGTAAVVREGVRRAQRAQYVRRSAEFSKRRRGSARRGASAVCAMLKGSPQFLRSAVDSESSPGRSRSSLIHGVPARHYPRSTKFYRLRKINQSLRTAECIIVTIDE